MSGDVATGLDACNDCALSSGGGCCGGDGHGGGASRSDRAVAASTGAVAVLLALATASVGAVRASWALFPAAVTALLGAVLAIAGLIGLRAPAAVAARGTTLALRLVPVVAAAVLVTLVGGLVVVLST